MPELDERQVAVELLDRPREIVERDRLVDDVGRELEQDAAELAALAQRLQRAVEAAEHLGAQLPWRPVDPAAVVDRHHVAQVLGQRLELDRMARHQPERLHVHREVLGCPLGPVGHELRVREAVVGRVRLDGVEALGVVADPRLARADVLRIPDLRQRLVGPGARADANGGAHPAIVDRGMSAPSRS